MVETIARADSLGEWIGIDAESGTVHVGFSHGFDDDTGAGLQLLALDKGQGIARIDEALRRAETPEPPDRAGP